MATGQKKVALLDLLKEVWLRLRGQAYANDRWGRERIVDSLNRAIITIAQNAGRLGVAGDLAVYIENDASFTINGVVFTYDLAGLETDGPTGLSAITCDPLVISAVELDLTDGTQCQTQMVSLEEWSDISNLQVSTSVFHWATTGSKVLLRPPPPSSSTLRIHYIRFPVALSADTDYFPLPVGLFRAVSTLATADLMQQLTDISQQEKDLARAESDKAIADALRLHDFEVTRQWANRTGSKRPPVEVSPGALAGK